MAAQQSTGFSAEARATFAATLFRPDTSEKIGAGVLLALPADVSAILSTRGMAPVAGTINGAPFRAVLEPDGRGSHWFRVGDALRTAANASVGDTVTPARWRRSPRPSTRCPAPTRRWCCP